MVTPGVRCELVELVKYEDRKEDVLGVEFKDPAKKHLHFHQMSSKVRGGFHGL